MDGEYWRRRTVGHVDVTELPSAGNESRHILCTWRPPYHLSCKLQGLHTIAFECDSRPGFRRFTPACSIAAGTQRFSDLSVFAQFAASSGRAILWDQGKHYSGRFLTFGEAMLFSRHVQHMQEHLGPTRKLHSQLFVCAGGRLEADTRDILPNDFGLDSTGHGNRWNVARLKQEGLREARTRGITKPTTEEVFRLGLLARATDFPLLVSDEASDAITRMALFRLTDQDDSVSASELEYVATRIREFIRRSNDDSDEEFRNWIFDSKSSFVRSIQRSKRDLSRSKIRRALIEIGWWSLKQVGMLIDVQMRAFRDALPYQLTADEDVLFEQMYLGNPAFGGLPLVLLHDRFSFIKEAVLDVWMNSDIPRSIATLRAMLYFYSVLANNRRLADRTYAKRRWGRQPRIHFNAAPVGAALEQQLFEDVPQLESISESSEFFTDIALAIAIEKKVTTDLNSRGWSAHLIRSYEDVVTFALNCPCHGFEAVMVVNNAYFHDAARRVQVQRQK